MKNSSHILTSNEVLETILEKYAMALTAERDFIDWEHNHRHDGPCDEFAKRFYIWLDKIEPFAAAQSVIEERFPELRIELERKLQAFKATNIEH